MYLQEQIIDTIYFGGGTPSILLETDMIELLKTIDENFSVSRSAEITLECNPDDLSEEKLLEYKKMGVNRLSIGIQSFIDKELKLLNRGHSCEKAIQSIKDAKKVGFENITIDLIYGLPKQTLNDWKKNINIFLELDLPHLSAYCLTIENKTLLHHQIKKNILPKTNEDLAISHFQFLQEKLKKHSFIQYEISNFGKEGCFSKHNIKYWKRNWYLGIGPSAHSYNGESRRWNFSSNKIYIDKLNKAEDYFELEMLTSKQNYNEYIFTTLRTIWGVDLGVVKNKFCTKIYKNLQKSAEKWIKTTDLTRKRNTLYLTEKGKLMADAISADLFEV